MEEVARVPIFDDVVAPLDLDIALLLGDAFEEIFADGGFKRIEFYGRVMDWHTKWSDDIRTLFHVNCARWAAVWKVRRLLRRGG